ncbi:MAG: hypothetical protein KDJ28_00580 [Candidatus Competibacteraceae bacterium]|nr:hypothetical protein [Candidatus Competibacteraceae bacterium]
MNSKTEMARLTMRNYLPVILAGAAGLPVANDEGTRQMIREFRHDNLLEIAEMAGFARAQNSSDFAAVMGTALSAIINANFWPEYRRRLDTIARLVPVENFNETTVATITPPALCEVEEDAKTVFSPLTITSQTGKIKTFEAVMTVSRQVWSSLGESLVQAVSQLSKSIYELELSLIAEALTEINFDTDNSTASALDITTLDSAMGWLESSALTPSALMLAPGKTATVKTLLDAANLDFNLVVNPSLPPGAWYLLANPKEKAAIGKLVLRSDLMNNALAPRIGWTRIDTSRIGYYLPHDTGFIGMDRTAVYRGGV